MTRTNWRPIIAAASLLAALLVVPAPAHADEPEAHCVAEAQPIGTERVEDPVCFDTAAEAEEYLEELGVGAQGRGTAASIILGTAYKDANRTGSSFTFWGSSGCSGVTFGFASLASGWDNSISSAAAVNGCWVTLYSATGYGGSRLNCTPVCNSVGALNDQIKSVVFRPTGTFG